MGSYSLFSGFFDGSFSPHFILRLITVPSCKLTVDAEGTVKGTLGLTVAEPDATGLLLDLFVLSKA
jgi:hypothetical protein